ncbi:hypothetical protein RRG58_06230 [Mycoplasmopsis cynos]|nr:hypothetical protein [Mycoplasmopsis felis]WQQ11265.1 hypothetical protein RRG50_02330 [Mycoplasmopsis felis]
MLLPKKVAEVFTKIQQTRRHDVLDAEYAQAQTEAQNAINNLPEGSRTTLQSRLNNTNPTPTKEQVEQIKNDAIELKTVQDQTVILLMQLVYLQIIKKNY